MLKKCLLIICLLILFSFNVSAESTYSETFNNIGGNKIYGALPDETKEILNSLNINAENENFAENLSAKSFFALTKSFFENYGEKPLKMFALCLVGIFVFAGINAFGGENYKTVLHICSLFVCFEIITEVCSLISATAVYLVNVSTFSTVFIPVLAAANTLAGKAVTSVKVLTPVLSVSTLLSLAGNFLVLPLMSAGTAVTVISAVCPNLKLSLGESIKKAAVFILSFAEVLFLGVISCIGKISSAVDGVSLKTAKFFVSGVPYVGSALGEMSAKIFAGLNLLKSGIGIYGIIAYFALMLPVLIQSVIWYLGLLLLKTVCEFLSLQSLIPLLSGLNSMLSVIIAIILLGGGVFIISSAVVIGL